MSGSSTMFTSWARGFRMPFIPPANTNWNPSCSSLSLVVANGFNGILGAAPPKPKQAKELKPKKNGTPQQATNTTHPAVQEKGRTGVSGGHPQRDVGLTVRIEVNLPPAADQETYDRIFKSIRANLLNQ